MAREIAENGNRNDDVSFDGNPAHEAERLRGALERLNVEHKFKPGDIIRWKSGLKNKNLDFDQPIIVTAVFEEPILGETDESGSAYFREPLSLRIAEYDDDRFIEWYVDARRFEPFPEEEIDLMKRIEAA